MEKTRPPKRCSCCGQASLYLRDFRVQEDKVGLLDFDVFEGALFRCPSCGHFDFFEREEDREARIQEAQRKVREREYYASLPDYFCPRCRREGKTEQCPYCGMTCLPVQKDLAPEEPPDPEPDGPKKKRRWFGRDDEAGRED